MAKEEENNWFKAWILKAAGPKNGKGHAEDDPGNLFKEINQLRKKDSFDSEAAERDKFNDGVMGQMATSKVMEFSTLGMICFNALAIGYDTNYTALHYKPDNLLDGPIGFIIIENMFCTYFTCEVIIRFLAYRRKTDCVCDAWFVFDSLLVSMMIIETWILPFLGSGGPLGNLSIFRLLRLLRITRISRLMRAVPEIMVICKGMVASARTVACTGALLLCVLYTYSILFTDAYHERVHPEGEDPDVEAYFGTMGKSMFSLFIYATILDDLTACSDAVRETDNIWMMVALITFILISSFMMLNMLIGILVEVVSATAEGENSQAKETRVREAISHIFERMDQDSNKEISRGEFLALRKDKNVMAALQDLEITPNHFHLYAELFFKPEEGTGRVRNLSFDRLVALILRLTPGNFVSALDFAAFSKTISGIHQKVKERVIHLEDLCEEMAEPELFAARMKQLSAPEEAVDGNPGAALPAPPGPAPGVQSDAVSTGDKASPSSPSLRKDVLSNYDRERLDRTDSTDIIEELQRRLGMPGLDQTGAPTSMTSTPPHHMVMNDMQSPPKEEAPELSMRTPSNQAFVMLGVPDDDNDSETVYV